MPCGPKSVKLSEEIVNYCMAKDILFLTLNSKLSTFNL
jgi:hypothetical protein